MRTVLSRELTSISRFGIKIHWEDVQEYYDAGHSTKECVKYFKISIGSLYNAKKRGRFQTRPKQRFDLQDALSEKSTKRRYNIKKHLIKSGVVENKCSNCGIEPVWDGKPLVMILDHKNGVNDDNRIENLRLLCPNCNSQTETFCKGHGKKKSPVKTKQLVEAIRNTDSIKDALLSLGMDPTSNNYARITRLSSGLS